MVVFFGTLDINGDDEVILGQDNLYREMCDDVMGLQCVTQLLNPTGKCCESHLSFDHYLNSST